MHGYETEELRRDHLDALVVAKDAAAARIAHAESELETVDEGPQKAYLERVIERSTAEMAACAEQLTAFSIGAKTRRGRSSRR